MVAFGAGMATNLFPLTFEVGVDSGVLLSGARPPLPFGPPPEFGGDAHVWSPEHLLLSAAVACFLETFHSIARKHGLTYGHPTCRAKGTLERAGFTSMELFVELTVADGDAERAQKLLVDAKARCFVANTLKCPVELRIEMKKLARS
jgi:organic hydroperoxide reductase OsmC/OhrA